MQFIPENLKRVLNDKLKAGFVSRPKIRVEVDRMTFIPGHVEEITFYDYDFIKTISSQELGPNEEIITGDIKATFPMKGITWGDLNKKFYKTSNYGSRNGRLHRGTDMQSKSKAADIVAMWDGTVLTTGYQAGGAGNYVTIDHGNGVVTKYFHLKSNSIVVKKDQKVVAGQKLGIEGNTGNVQGVTGIHLHVEVWLSGNSTDPLPYLKGEKTIKGSKTVIKDTVTNTTTEVKMEDVGYPGEVIFLEEFKSPAWAVSTLYDNFTPASGVSYQNRALPNGYYRPTWKFSSTSAESVRVAFNITMPEEGFFNFTFSGNFSGSQGDFVMVAVNGGNYYKSSEFLGIGKAKKSVNIKVPTGNVRIDVVFFYNGKKAGSSLKECSLHSMRVQTLDKVVKEPVVETGTEEIVLPQSNGESFKYVEKEILIQLEVGKFVYQDTLVLPNVQQCEVQRNLDQEAAEAKLTISNPDGKYSPDYNPYYFPDLSARNEQSPYSYTIPGGFHMGVLSENTPIRIYMGYGHDDHRPIRIFTGLIDSVTVNGGDGTMEINARDMYKKIINTVLMRRKVYGKPPTLKKVASVSNGTGNLSVGSLSRRDQIYYWAFKKCEEWGLPKDCAYFLLAICRHETQLGTAGQGKPPRDMILGYGSYNTNPDYSYGGIEKQMHYGAKRIKDALKSRDFIPKSHADVKYFWKGGDYGAYQWATDTNWPNSVWAVYKQITANKSSYQPPKLETTQQDNDVVENQNDGEQWLKTAIIQDLINEAGMYGWRSAVDDMRYPDSVVEESYVIEVNPRTGKVVKALPEDKITEEKMFEVVPIESIRTADGYLNPFVEPAGKTFYEFQLRIAEAIQDLIKDTNYRSYCDRYGTYRLEQLDFEGPVVAEFKDDKNLISINKTIDHMRSRSHIVVFHDAMKVGGADTSDRVFASFIDKEMLLELKGEVRTMSVSVPWARANATKKEVAKKLFFQMKQLSRTLQASIPGIPNLDILDRVKVVDRNTTTSATYYVKGIRDSFDVDSGYIQIIDLTWAAIDQMVQLPGLVMNSEPPVYEEPKPDTEPGKPGTKPKPKCEPYPGKAHKYGMTNNAIVKKIQKYLMSEGYKLPKYGADGNFGSETLAAVKAYQKDQKIAVDGSVGPITWNKMFCPNGS